MGTKKTVFISTRRRVTGMVGAHNIDIIYLYKSVIMTNERVLEMSRIYDIIVLGGIKLVVRKYIAR